MVRVDNQTVQIDKFPDGTLHIVPPSPVIYEGLNKSNHGGVTITWFYENNEEMMAVLFLARHYQNMGAPVRLIMPYIPNARQDRVKSKQDLFTLRYFAEYINVTGFTSVTVLDPHSSVSEALFNNVIIESPKKYIDKAIGSLSQLPELIENPDSFMVFYPDEGAMKRYSGMLNTPYAFGIKRRDWETGKIQGLDIAGRTDLIKGSNILIIDDICSRGGTFYHSAKKLKELGADHIYLYVSHCEPTILDGEIFTSGLIDKVFTTNSIFGEKDMERAKEIGVDDKIEVFYYEKQY
ncbi:MAG: ribose-phosphate pyrophosphokinase [Eubacterium sp.]|nr:ribose-phosphate pyrophosphokinase [Eubacterium sp.]